MSASKARGTRFESLVCAYLAEHGFPHAERRASRGVRDAGDIAGVPGVCIEAKATARIDLATFVDEAQTEAANAGVSCGVTVIKRRMRPVGDAYAVMPLRTFVALIADQEVPDGQ